MRIRLPIIGLLITLCVFGDLLAGAPLKTNLLRARSTADERWPANTPLRVCALRVQFAVDQITGTTGTGEMESGFDSSLTIDPLPHDRAYFEDHLSFLKHYYETVSNQRLRFDTCVVFPASDTDVYRLDYPMWHYNHNDGDDELLNRRLTELFVQAVGKATDVDFTQFDAVLVFHAGTGKDFNLGYDATPFDIPSAYISAEDIRSFALDAALPRGVTRGIILPEGENQAEALDYGIELSLNGIMVKLFGNWLGLPDLFDTKTGNSGIGRWGMMDQGSGNVSALVPAMPDAWSRVYMGWDDASEVLPTASGDTVHVARFGHISFPRVIRFPVTPREYYLLENRYSNPDSIADTNYVVLRDRAGRELRVNHNGDLFIEPGFRVAVEAGHYDFGIPGSGLLLWHIDEDVIVSGLSDNSVNTDPDHRGVDLVEADGAQDIGRTYGFGSAGSGAELGVAEDAWYLNNVEHRAANRDALVDQFTGRTFPAARFYDGSYTRVEFTGFSRVDTVMSFVARLEGMQAGFPVSFSFLPAEWAVADLDGDSIRDIYFLSNGSLFQRDSLLKTIPDKIGFASACSATDLDGDGGDELIFEGSRIGFGKLIGSTFVLSDTVLPGAKQSVFAARNSDGSGALLSVTDTLDTLTATWYNLTFEPVAMWTLPTSGAYSVLNVERFPSQRFVLVVPGQAMCIHSPGLDSGWEQVLTDSRIEGIGTIVAEPDTQSVFLNGLGYVNIADGTVLCYTPECLAPLEDWDQDGIPDGGGRFGRQDAPHENAPSFDADVTQVYDLEADGDPDLLGFSKPHNVGAVPIYTRISAVSHEGIPYSSFPIAVTVVKDSEPFLWDHTQSLYFLSVTYGRLSYYYAVHRLTGAFGSQRFSYREPVNIINVGPLRPYVHAHDEWVYCWPNPVSSQSRIRVTLPYPARATAQIFDLAGRRVATLSDESNLAGPFEIIWNVEHVESGVYLARVKAEGGGQSRESQIKIAVVK